MLLTAKEIGAIIERGSKSRLPGLRTLATSLRLQLELETANLASLAHLARRLAEFAQENPPPAREAQATLARDIARSQRLQAESHQAFVDLAVELRDALGVIGE